MPRLTALIRHTTVPDVAPTRGDSAPSETGSSEIAAERHTIRDESDRALLVLDMTISRVSGPHAVAGASAIVRFVQGELRYFRERGRPVVFACGGADQVILELTPRSDEVVLRTSAPSAFFGTGLDAALSAKGVRRLTLVGLETHTSVLLTAADALARGYQVVVPDPCVCAQSTEAHAAALLLLRRYWTAAPSPSADPAAAP
jgi:nicotinamidase-related amidase